VIRYAVIATTVALAAPALAQPAGSPSSAEIQAARERGHNADALRLPPAPDATRLVAAQKLIGTLIPPTLRDRMVDDMMRPMMANMRQAMIQSPQMQSMLASDPKVQGIFTRFMDAQFERVTDTVRKGMPGMMEAMSRAYARRFTLPQMAEIGAFFATPTGQAYVQQAPTIMNDPDVATWMRQYMTSAMADMPGQVDALMQELAALEKDKP
jgi:hypothetical protein